MIKFSTKFVALILFCSAAWAQELSLNLLNQNYLYIKQELVFKRAPADGKLLGKEESEVLSMIKHDPKVAWNNYGNISFASFDLDQDSEKEIFAYHGKGMSCQSGCGILQIYRNRYGPWKLIASFSGVEEGVAVLTSKTNNFYDLALSFRMINSISSDFEWSSEQVKWGNNTYRSDGLVSKIGYDEERIPLRDNLKFTADQIYKTFYQKEFFTILSKSDDKGRNEYLIGLFGADGRRVLQRKIFDEGFVSEVGATHRYRDGFAQGKLFVAVPFIVSYEDGKTAVGVAIIDDSGKRVRSKIIESGDEDHIISEAGFVTDYNKSKMFGFRNLSYIIKGADGKKKRVVQPIEKGVVEKGGAQRDFNAKEDRLLSLPGRSSLSLSDGVRVAAIGEEGHVEIASPKLRAVTKKEIIPNYSLESGDQFSNPKFKVCMVTFMQGKKTNFTILPNPHSVLLMMGIYGDKPPINIPLESFDDMVIFAVARNQYSEDDILSGRFRVSNDLVMTKERAKIEAKKRTEEANKRKKDCEVRKKAREAESKNQTSSFTDDEESDEYCGDGYYDEEVLDDCKLKEPKFNGNTVVELIHNRQTLVLVNVDPVDVALSPEKYFSLKKTSFFKRWFTF